ncbi:EamA family transporter [Paracoccus pacificus]|uniref:EamA family transporter n=1 Tax=Paracoccus pacificus TaxID=1463598 RepID=A0ABW4R4V8_9RHOB
MSPKDILLAGLIAVAWGFNFVVIKVGLQNFPPLLFSALRFTLAAVPLVFFLPRPAVSWRIILGIGTVLGVIKFSLLFVGMDLGVSAGLASLLLQSQAFFTLILAALILHDRPTGGQIAGVFVAFCGIALVATSVDAGFTVTGLVLLLGAGLAWGFSNIIMRHAGPVNMLNLMVWVSLVPSVPMLILSLLIEGADADRQAIAALNWYGVGAVLYVAYVATILGFAGWGYLISRHGAGQVAPFSLLVPIFGMLSSALILGESFGPARLAGAALVLVGLLMTVIRKPRQRPGATQALPPGA